MFLLNFFVQRLKPGEDDVDGPKAIEHFPSDKDQTIVEYVDEYGIDKSAPGTVLAPRADGLVREMKTKKIISREEIQERTETEDVKHLGDFSDEVSPIVTLSNCRHFRSTSLTVAEIFPP